MATDIDAASEMLKETFEILTTHQILSKVLFSAMALLVLAVFLTLYKNMLMRMVEARRIQEEAAVRLYRIVELTSIVVILMAIAYFVTRSHYLLLFLTGLALIVVASSWEIIQNIVYYYIMLFTGVVRVGNLVVLEDGRAGRVSDIKLFVTVITRHGSPKETYIIPNRVIMSRGFRVVDEGCVVRVRVRVEGVTMDALEAIRDILDEKVREISKSLAAVAPLERSYRTYLEEITNNSATMILTFVTPPLEGREFRLYPLLYLLAAALRESGYTRFAVEIASVTCGGGGRASA